jgi:hypothetical protein
MAEHINKKFNVKVELVQTQPVADSVEQLKNYGDLNERE